MKILITLSILIVFSNFAIFSQNSDGLQMNYLQTGGGHHFKIVGSNAYQMVDSLFSKLSETTCVNPLNDRPKNKTRINLNIPILKSL